MDDSDFKEIKWRYQIIDHGTPEQPDYWVHEVYFETETKRIVTHTLDSITLQHYESKEELIEVVEMILKDLKKERVLTIEEVDKDIFQK